MTSDPLKPQAKVREYVILRVLGNGSYGITYLATDTKEDRPVAIKEYFPMRFAKRGPKGIVVSTQPAQDDVEDFDSGLSKFLEEAATLAGFHDDNIVEVYDWFEYNGTAYVVMRYEEGSTLSRYLGTHRELIPENEILSIFVPLLKGLRTVHAKWFLHRDIKPENIYLRRDGEPLLIDFGTARHAASARQGGMTAYLTPGFAPPEQYARRGDHGPWTDIYALGATMYYCVTRIVPYDGGDRYLSLMRSQTDPLVPATQAAPSMYSKELLEVIDWMMAPDHSQRPASVDEVLGRVTALPAYDGAPEGRRAEPVRQAAAETSRPTVVASTEPAPTPAPTPMPTPAPTPEPVPPPAAGPAAPTQRMDVDPSGTRQQTAVPAAGETVRVEPDPGTEPPPAATTPAATAVTGSPAQKNPLLMYGAVALVVIVLAGLGLLVWRGDEPPTEPVATPEPETQPEPDVVQSESLPSEQVSEMETEAERQQREQAEAEAEQRRQEIEQAEQQRLQEQQAAAERARFNELLDRCASQLAAGPVTGPSGEQALACYRQALEQRPQNQTAADAVTRIERGYLDEVQKALDTGAHAQARSYVDKLKALGLAPGRVGDLENRVARRTPGETIEDALKDGGFAPVLVVVPGGTYAMGCDGSAACTDEQQPVRNVQITQPFLISRFEVTFDDYDRFAGATGRPLPNDLGWGRGQRPVINVTWDQAVGYTEWLSEQTGQPYRLVSEAEWEYVARSGKDEKYFFGDDESKLCTYGNHADAETGLEWRNPLCSDGFRDRTAPVGRYSFNGWNVYDLLGNVWEWTADCWHDNYQQAPEAAAPWLDDGSGDCTRRVIRGGSWYDGPGMLLPGVRNWAVTNERNNVLGFRVAADVN